MHIHSDMAATSRLRRNWTANEDNRLIREAELQGEPYGPPPQSIFIPFRSKPSTPTNASPSIHLLSTPIFLDQPPAIDRCRPLTNPLHLERFADPPPNSLSIPHRHPLRLDPHRVQDLRPYEQRLPQAVEQDMPRDQQRDVGSRRR